MPPELTLIGGLFLLILLRVPIAVALGVASVLAAWQAGVPPLVVAQRMATGVNAFALLAIPFFILAGNIMAEGGISTRLVAFARVIVGPLPGGLALVNVLTSMFFGGISGSAVADVASEGPIILPMMRKAGYPMPYAVAVTVTSATQGIIIPPSHNMVIYSLVAGGVSISALFLAGYIPGIMIGLSLMAVAYMVARRDKHPTEQRPPFRESLRISLEAIPGLGLGLVIIGGIVSGVFTATESAAVGAIYALLLSVFLYRELTWKKFVKVLSATGRSIAVVIFLIATASAFGWMMAYLQIPSRIAEGMLSVSTTYIGVMLMVNVLLMLLGMIMDFAPILLILTPVLLPVVQSVGVDPVHFGIIMMVNLSIGLTTPPVGTVLFVGCALAKIPIESVVRPMIPFWVAMLVVLLIITYVPGLVMLGPRLFGAG